MIMTAPPETATQHVLHKLGHLQQARRGRRLVWAMLWTLAVMLTASGIAISLDAYFGWWSMGLRVMISALVAAIVMGGVGWSIYQKFRRWSAAQLASLADDKTPQMQERLQTLVSVGRTMPGRNLNVDRIMLSRVAGETEEMIDQFDPRSAALENSLVWPGAAIFVGVLIWFVVAVTNSNTFGVLVWRLVAPVSSATCCLLDGVPGDQVVARGDAWKLELLAGGATGNEVVLERQFAGSAAADSDSPSSVQSTNESVTLVSSDRQFGYRERRASESFRYRLTTGDLRTPWYDVTVADRPRIRGVRAIVTPPAYTQLPPKTYQRIPNRLVVIEGSEVKWVASVVGQVDHAVVKIQDAPARTMLATGAGMFEALMSIQTETKVSIEAVERHGLKNLRSPKCHLLTRPDLPPTVRIHSPSPDQQVRPDDTIELKFEAKDDVGLARARLVVQVENSAVDAEQPELEVLYTADIPVPANPKAPGQPIKKWNGKTKLDLSQFALEEGQTLSYRIEVFDTKQAERLQQSESEDDADQDIQDSKTIDDQDKSHRRPASHQSSGSQQNSHDGEDANLESPQNDHQTGAPPNQSGTEFPSDDSTAAKPLRGQVQSTESASDSSPQAEDSQDNPPARADQQSSASSQSTASTIPPPNQDSPKNQAATSKQRVSSSQPARSQQSTSTDSTESPRQAADQTPNAPPQNSPPSRNPSSANSGSSSAESDSPKSLPETQNAPLRDQTEENSDDDQRGDDENNPPGTTQNAAPSNQRSSGESRPSSPANRSQNSTASQSQNGSSNTNRSETSRSQSRSGGQANSQPGGPMTRRHLDLPQPSSSQPMRLRVTRTVGSFSGKSRKKLEVAIAGSFRAVETELQAACDELSQIVTSNLEGLPWGDDDRDHAIEAHERLQRAIDQSNDLIRRTKGTHYVFVSLQLGEIAATNITPARQDTKSALSTSPQKRIVLITSARQQAVRALNRLRALYRLYDNAKTNFEAAKTVREIENLYRVFLEDTMIRLARTTDQEVPTGIQRKPFEFDLDEEYLKELEEYLKKRRDLRVTLAKILSSDPRLMRRFFQNSNNQTRSIRNQLLALAHDQHRIAGWVNQYASAAQDEAARQEVSLALVQQLATESMNFVQTAIEIEEQFETWAPLQESNGPEMQIARDAFWEVSAAASGVITAMESPEMIDLLSGESMAFDGAQKLLRTGVTAMQSLSQSLDGASAKLAEIADGEEELVQNAARRIIDIETNRADVDRWIMTAKMLADSDFGSAVGVQQWRIAGMTHDMTEKLTNLQGVLAGQFRTNTLPVEIAQACDDVVRVLDREVEPQQLASIRALRKSQWSRALTRVEAATAGIDRVCQLIDELLRRIVEHLDNLPPDPLAQFQDDPTLDELLRALEREREAQDRLRIPRRPTNLQIVNDWNSGRNGPTSGAQARILSIILQSDAIRQREAVKRLRGIREKMAAGLTGTRYTLAEPPPTAGGFGWAQVRGELGKGLLQESQGEPPAEYGRAINQYHEMTSHTK